MKTVLVICLLFINLSISLSQPRQIMEMGGSIPGNLKVYNDKLFFSSDINMNGNGELWIYDSKIPQSSNNPKMLVDLSDSTGPAFPKELTIYNNKLFFSTNNGLYSYDDNLPISKTNPLKIFALSAGLGVYNNLLYFSSVISNYRIICVYDDNQSLSTTNPKPLYKTDPFSSNRNEAKCSNLFIPLVYQNKLYFSAYDVDYNGDQIDGEELWVYDDRLSVSPNNPKVLMDINLTRDSVTEIEYGSNPNDFKIFNNKLYLSADDGTGSELWCFDNINSPYKVYDIDSTPYGARPNFKTIYNDTLYFSANSSTYGTELWAYDGINNPFLVYDINPGTNYSIPSYLTVFENKLVFNADDGTHGRELWAYDANNQTSVKNPFLIYDLYPGIGSGMLVGDGNFNYVEYDSLLYFGGSNGYYKGGLWSFSFKPSINTATQNVNICANSDINLNFSVFGYPPYKYNWYKDDTLILQEHSNPYKINKIQGKNKGIYKCMIKNDYDSTTAIFNVNVNKLPIFKLRKDTTINVNDSILIIGPSNMSSYKWSNGATSSKIYFKGVIGHLGDNLIYLIVTDSNNCQYSDSIHIDVNKNNSIKNIESLVEYINIYPNPSNDVITIDFPVYTGTDKTSIELYSITGELIKAISIQNRITQLNISDLAKGVYVIKVMKDKGVEVKRVVKE